MRAAMRMVVAALVAFVGVGAAGLSSAGQACACSCAPLSVDEVIDGAGAIVQGRAVAEREEGGARIYEFEVDASYKKQVHERIDVATSLVSASCGVSLEIGEDRMLVLGYGTPIGVPDSTGTGWTAALCSNISALGAGQIPAAAGPRLDPIAGSERPSDVPDASGSAAAGDDDPMPLWIITAVVLLGVVVVGGGVVLATRQSRR